MILDVNFLDLKDFENQKDNFDKPQNDELVILINQLKYCDMSKRIGYLLALNDLIESNKKKLMLSANALIEAFTHVLNDIFEKPVEDIHLRFAKYFTIIVLKACSCKELIRECSEDRIFYFAEQLLMRLLIDGLDQQGDQKEGEQILK